MSVPVCFFLLLGLGKKFRRFAAILPRKKNRRFAVIYKETARIVYNIDRNTTRGYCAPQARKFWGSKRAFEHFPSNFDLKIALQQPICWLTAGQIFWLPAFGRIFFTRRPPAG